MSDSNTTEPLWLTINDPEISAADLVDLVNQRTEDRRAELGYEPPRQFPTFGHVVTMPVPTDGDSPSLFHHLQQLNNDSLPETNPVLAESAALRVPILGRLWRLIRGEMHNLVLFYVNRHVAHETAVDTHIISTLNELTRLNQAQRHEIEQLRTEIAQLKAKSDLPYD